jgi:hypothetical protein
MPLGRPVRRGQPTFDRALIPSNGLVALCAVLASLPVSVRLITYRHLIAKQGLKVMRRPAG